MSILDAIDGALHDYAVSTDAMRWAPEESRTASAPSLDDIGAIFRRLTEDWQRMAEAMRPVVEAHAKACAKFTHSIDRGLWPDRHRRCVTCQPWRKPKPLAVNGHEYQRRLRARRRRR